MGLPHFCIRRPVTTVMIMVFIVLFGGISLVGLPQELFPPIVYPQLTVVTVYSNAAPEEIETLITKPVEEAVGTVSGLRRVKSISREGISLVIAEFGWNEDMDFASLKLREKVDRMKAFLPRESSEPLVLKYLQMLPTGQIVRILGISKNTLQVRLNRARKRLKPHLADLIQEDR